MSSDLRASAQRLQNVLNQLGVSVNVVEFKELTRTAQEAADVIGCEVGQIAKTLIFKGETTGKPFCIIASGVNRVDEAKVAALVGEKISRPDADFVLKHTGFAIGGIPPVGYTFDTKPLIDEDLMQYQEIWAAAGTPHAVFSITPQELVKITEGQVATVKK